MSWTVTLQKPGRRDYTAHTPYLGARIELPVDRYCATMPLSSTYLMTLIDSYVRQSFIETYEVQDVIGQSARAVFTSIRRSPELSRHFNPQRLPL